MNIENKNLIEEILKKNLAKVGASKEVKSVTMQFLEDEDGWTFEVSELNPYNEESADYDWLEEKSYELQDSIDPEIVDPIYMFIDDLKSNSDKYEHYVDFELN